MEGEYEGDDKEKIECEFCGRGFNEDAIDRHTNICQKTANKKRKAFNMKKQRIVDDEHEAILRLKELEEKRNAKKGMNQKPGNANASKKPKWQRQSDELRAIARLNLTATSGFGSKIFYNIKNRVEIQRVNQEVKSSAVLVLQ